MDEYEEARLNRHDAPPWKRKLAKEILAPRRKRFKRRKVYSPAVDYIWTGDLMFMQKYARENNGYKYILVVLDVFSRYAWARPLKDKTAPVTARAFQDILLSSSPKKLWCDQGTEFTGAAFKRLLREHNIILYHTFNDVKASIAERFIRTLRRKIESDYILTHSTVWYKILPELIHEYNNTYHRSIKMTPEEARMPRNFTTVYENLYPTRTRVETSKFNVGDKVRITLKKRTFEKEAHGNWTEEIFEISKILTTNPIVYKIKDLADEEIQGTFYKEQLQKTNQCIYRIDRILQRRQGQNGPEVLVRWFNYPSKFDSWEKEDVIHRNGNR